MKQLHKQMLVGFLFPIISALITLFMPVYDKFFGMLSIAILIIIIMLPILLLLKYKKRKNKDIIFRLTSTYMMYFSLLFYTFPLLKMFSGNFIVQLLLISFFVGIYYLARHDQNTEVPIVYPGAEKDNKKIAYVYYAMPIIFVMAGGGGNIIVGRYITEILGYSTAMMMFSTVIYLFSCWILFFFSSLIYKSHVKEGILDK